MKPKQVLLFDRKDYNFQKQQIRFQACAKIARFTKAISKQPKTDLLFNQTVVDALAENYGIIKRNKKAANRNNAAMVS